MNTVPTLIAQQAQFAEDGCEPSQVFRGHRRFWVLITGAKPASLKR